MNKPIPVAVHGVLDYLSAALLMALPRIFGWNRNVTRLLTASALATIVYSLLTRYRFGLLKLIPFKGHLLLDALSGLTLATSPLWLPDEANKPSAVLLGLGLFEIVTPSLTQTEPAAE